jgi:hypothetical protein
MVELISGQILFLPNTEGTTVWVRMLKKNKKAQEEKGKDMKPKDMKEKKEEREERQGTLKGREEQEEDGECDKKTKT